MIGLQVNGFGPNQHVKFLRSNIAAGVLCGEKVVKSKVKFASFIYNHLSETFYVAVRFQARIVDVAV